MTAPKTGSAIRFARSITWILDVVAIASLMAVPEVHPAILIPIGIFFVFSRLGGGFVRLSEGILTIFLALISLVTVLVILRTRIPIVVAMAHAAPIFHALLWFARGGLRDLWLRVSVGFVELILASALTAEFYLPIAIFTFAIASALMMASTYVAMTAELSTENGSNPERADIPPNYLIRAFFLALLALATATVIFPMLPRGQALGGVDFRQGRVGYTEDVSVTGEKSFEGAGGGDVVLRIFFADGREASSNTDLLTDIYFGLIRGKALSHFDGINWSAENRANRTPAQREAEAPNPTENPPSNARHRFANLELIREPLTEVLPVPYGVRNVWMFSNSGFNLPKRLNSGEWADTGLASYRVRYRAVLDLDEAKLPFGSGPEDFPSDDNLVVPPSLRSERMLKLAQRLFSKEKDASPSEKARAVMTYFAAEHFAVSDGTVDEDIESASARVDQSKGGWTGLEHFLFLSKKGHCELFATAAAVLLRLSGVPTRLMSGFRVSRFPSGGVLSVRSGDAHAWVEYWVPESGWKPLDVTPRLALPSSFTGYFREAYETLSNYWYRYIFTPDPTRGRTQSGPTLTLPPPRPEGDLERSARKLFADSREFIIRAMIVTSLLLALTLAIAWYWFPWLFTIRARVREGPTWLKKERVRMEFILRRRIGTEDLKTAQGSATDRFGERAGEAVANWISLYYRARFGRPEAEAEPRLAYLEKLRVGRRAVEAAAKSTETRNRAA